MNDGKRQLFQRLLETRPKKSGNPGPRAGTGPFPLSFSQQQMWALYKSDPRCPAYNVIRAFRITGPLKETSFVTAVESVLRRHEVFRLVFFEENGVPCQKAGKKCENYYQYIELFKGPEAERRDQALDIMQKEARQPFDLSAGNNIRIVLVKISGSEFYLLLVLPHIISDGWSMGVLLRELADFNSLSGISAKPELPLRFVDYAVWQNEYLTPQTLAPHEQFYKKSLTGIPFLLDLPSDRPRRSGGTFNGKRLSFTLNEKLTQKLEFYCRRKDITLYMVLVAALAVLLYRYSGQTQMTIGSPVASRNVRHVGNLIGCFMNTVVLAFRLDPDWDIRRLLTYIRDTVLKTMAHREMPFIKLVEKLRPQRKAGAGPLYNVLFTLQNTPGHIHEFADLNIEAVDIDNGTSKFDLNIIMSEAGKKITGAVEYNTGLFDPYRIENLVRHYQKILDEMTENPAWTIALLPLLSEPERQEMLYEWNKMTAEFPRGSGLHHLIGQYAQTHPLRTAVVCGRHAISYKQLDEKASVLAGFLRRKGLENGNPVGIFMGRSVETIAAILGVLKAGCLYVPLDPGYPVERLIFMVQDAGISTVIAHGEMAGFTGDPGVNVVKWEQVTAFSSQPPALPASPFDENRPAYIIYTSGSTGQPKGVVVSHKNVLAMLYGCEKVIETRENTTTTIAPFSFDVSVWEIFSTLCFGGTLHVIPNDLLVDTPRLARYLLDNRISRFYIYPFFISGLLKEWDNLEARPPLQLFMTGLEPKSQRLLQQVRNRLPAVQIMNSYGPTETTVMGTYFNFIKARDAGRPVPIGRPFPNYRTYIVDEHDQPVPVGIPGELLIGGEVVSCGYHHRPELQQKFPADPFRDGNARVYRSGDIAAYFPDGNIDFLGRLDHQVKIRGFRVEPGEIEVVMALHPAVDRAVVVVQDESRKGPGHGSPVLKKLVGYAACRKNVGPGEIRAFLKDKLPHHMVPSSLCILDELPLLSSGKVDRGALPDPETTSCGERPSVAPRSPLERIFVKIWAKLLGSKEPAVDDNIFDLGAHSLLIMQFIAHAKNESGVDIEMGDVFDYPTVAELATVIHERVMQTKEKNERT